MNTMQSELYQAVCHVVRLLDDHNGRRRGVMHSDDLGPDENDDNTTILKYLRTVKAKAEEANA